MTREEATLEMRYNNVNEEDIEAILGSIKQKNIAPQHLDDELEKMGYERIFYFEYEDGVDDGFFYSTKSVKKHDLND